MFQWMLQQQLKDTNAQKNTCNAPTPMLPVASMQQPTNNEEDDVPKMLDDAAADVDEDDDADDIERMERDMIASIKGARMKRPAAARASKRFPGAKVPLKRPAGAKATSAHNELQWYRGCRIYSSTYKGGYRVLMPGETRVDTLFKWGKSKTDALKTVKTAIDKASKKKLKK